MTTPAPAPRRRGRPGGADPEQALAAATDDFLAGRRIDLNAIAARLGVSRASLYRWFGSRDALIGEVLARSGEDVVRRAHADARGTGPRRLLSTMDRVNRELASARGLRALLAAEQQSALRTLTSSGGTVQPRMVAAVQAVIEAEAAGGHYTPPVPTATLAYAIVRIGEAFIYNDDVADIRGDVERLLQIEALLLQLPAAAATAPDAR